MQRRLPGPMERLSGHRGLAAAVEMPSLCAGQREGKVALPGGAGGREEAWCPGVTRPSQVHSGPIATDTRDGCPQSGPPQPCTQTLPYLPGEETVAATEHGKASPAHPPKAICPNAREVRKLKPEEALGDAW